MYASRLYIQKHREKKNMKYKSMNAMAVPSVPLKMKFGFFFHSFFPNQHINGNAHEFGLEK